MRTIHILVSIIALLLAEMTRGAGVTVITHGYEPLTDPHPKWVDEMGAAIVKRIGGAALISINIGSGSTTRELQSGSLPGGNSVSGEVVLKVFWNEIADAGWNPTSTEIATQVVPYLTSTLSWNGTTSLPFAQLPIHLIGHSRGGSVVSEICRLLGRQGIWVYQMTTLDPHPVRPLDIPPGNDAPVDGIWDTVLFADNLYELNGFLNLIPSGKNVNGADNTQLTLSPQAYPDRAGGPHSDIHLWYHGTIDNNLGASQEGHTITGTMRDAWYSSDEFGGLKAGFYYSRLGGGQWALDGFFSGYNDGNHNILPDTRVPVTRSASEWPSLIALTHNASSSVQAGTAFPLQCIFQSYDSGCSVTAYLDPDKNPYNGNEIAVTLSPVLNPQSATGSGTRVVNANGTVPAATPAGFYYVYGKITNPNGARYLYADASRQIRVVAAATPTFLITASYGPNGSISPSGTFARDAQSSVTLTATANAGYQVDTWYVNGLFARSGGASYIIPSLPADTAVQVTFRPTGGTPITGDLFVSVTPQAAVSAGAQWRFISPLVGNYQLPNVPPQYLVPGEYRVSFRPVSGYNTPADQTVNVVAGQTANVTGNYLALAPTTYTLIVNSGLNGSISWSPFQNQFLSEQSVRLSANPNPGYHFNGWGGALSGAVNPAILVMNSDKTVTATFASGDERFGTITVNIQPAGAAAAGVTWGFSGADYRNSGSSYSTFPGTYILTLHPVEGWTGPSTVVASIIAGQTANVTVDFAQDTTPGLLTVTLSPPDAVAAGAHWHVTGDPAAHLNGAILQLPPGTGYMVTFDPVAGWTSPPSQPVEIRRSQSTVVSGNYSPPLGKPVIVSLSPPVGALVGGTHLNIDGINFGSPASVLVGGRPASNITVVSASRISCVTPSNSFYGSVPVIVQTTGGNATNLTGFNYGVPRGTNITLVSSIGGRVDAVAVNGNYAYVGEGSSLVVLDVSNPDVPSAVGRCPLPGYAADIAFFTQSGRSYVCIAGRDSGLHVVDVTVATMPAWIGFYKTPGFCSGVATLGGLAYVADGDSGLEIFDLANPSAPVLLSAVPEAGFANEIAVKASVSGVYAYLSAGSAGMRIVDVIDPQAPIAKGSVSFGQYTINISVTTDRAYLTTQGGGYSFYADISNPDIPTNLGQFDSGLAYANAIQGTTLYSAGSAGLRVQSISIGMAPVLIGFLSVSDFTSSGPNMIVANGYAYVATGEDGLRIISISSPASPVKRGTFNSTAGYYSSVALSGNDAFLLTQSSGLKRFDVSNGASPLLLSQFVLPPSSGGVKVRLNGNRVFLLGHDGQFRILDATIPNQTPLLLGSTSQSQFYAFDFYLVGSTVVASGFDTKTAPFIGAIAAFDASDPGSLSIQHPFDFTPNFSAPAVGGNASLACTSVRTSADDTQLAVMNVSNPNSLQEIGQLPSSGAVRVIQLSPDNRYVHIGGQFPNLNWKIADLATPSAPVMVSTNFLGAQVFGFDVSNNTVYLATGKGILVYDVINPNAPSLLRSYTTAGAALDVKLAGNTLYVAVAEGGFNVLQLSDIDAPSIFITSPTALPIRTNAISTINLGGAASDNVGLSCITWFNNRGGGGEISPNESWTINNIALQPGTNLLTVTAFDTSGNAAVDTLTVIYQLPKTNQTITFPSIANRTFGDLPLILTAAASSGLPVSFSIVSGSGLLSSFLKNPEKL